jgi:hypothetical protein
MYDLSNVPDFEGLPVGTYLVKVYDFEPVTNPRSGNEGLAFKVKNAQGQTGKYTVWTTKDNGTTANLIGLKKLAKTCGITPEEMRGFQPAMLTGLKFIATVEVNKDKPEFTNVVRADPMPKEAQGDVGAQTASQQTRAVAPTPPQQAPERELGDDDLPF